MHRKISPESDLCLVYMLCMIVFFFLLFYPSHFPKKILDDHSFAIFLMLFSETMFAFL